MNRNNRSESVAPAKGSEKVLDVKQELATLGEIKSQYEDEIKKGKKLASDYFGLDEKVEEKKAELKSVSFDLAEMEKASKTLRSVEDQIKEKREELEELELKAIDKLRYEIAMKDKTKLDIESLMKEQVELEKDVKSLQKKKKEAEDKFNDVEQRTEQSLAQLAEELFAAQEKVAFAHDEADEIADEIFDLNNKKSKKSLEVDGLEMAAKDADKELAKVKEETKSHFDEKELQFETHKAKEIDELVQREGKASDKEKFLKIREDLLRSVKEQLEEKLGKKINNLDF